MSALGLSRIEATGALLALWGAALEDAPDGYLEAWTDADLAAAMELPETARAKPVGAALVSSGYAERNGHGLILHDWMAYQGNLRAAKLKAAWRAAKDNHGQSQNVRGQSEDSPKTVEDSPTLLADSRARADGTGRDVDGRESTSTHLPDKSGVSVSKTGKKPKREPEPEGFADAYAYFPRKTARRAAAKAFASALKRHPDCVPLDFVNAVKWYAERVEKEAIEARYIPHPATWFNQDRFLEEFGDEASAQD